MAPWHLGQESLGHGSVLPQMGANGDTWWRGKEENEAWLWGLGMTSPSELCEAVIPSRKGQPDRKAFCKATFLKLWAAYIFLGSGIFFLILHFNFNSNLKKELGWLESHRTLSISMQYLYSQWGCDVDKSFAGVWKEESAERVDSLIPRPKFYIQKNLLCCSQDVSLL